MGSLRCPECGSKNYQLVSNTQTQTTGGGFSAGKGCLGYICFGPLGILCGACGSGQKTTTTVTTECMCNDCGSRFKNPQDLKMTLDKYNEDITLRLIAVSVFFIISTLLISFALDGGPETTLFTLFIVLISLGIAFPLSLYLRKSYKTKLENELNDLLARMNRFEQ